PTQSLRGPAHGDQLRVPRGIVPGAGAIAGLGDQPAADDHYGPDGHLFLCGCGTRLLYRPLHPEVVSGTRRSELALHVGNLLRDAPSSPAAAVTAACA